MFRALLLCIAFTLFMPEETQAQDRNSVSVELPIRVSIIDFETTKKICGDDNPPHWCPEHLRKPVDKEDGEAIVVTVDVGREVEPQRDKVVE